ncbi:MAG TPA: rhomboid family intramembrane serine protease [Tepidisphaeraceae bacterium]|jgi:membrane associated rhomboid family serine protease
MGFEDRDYSRADYGRKRGWGGGLRMRALSVSMWLIILNVAVFLLDRVLERMGVQYILTTAAGRLAMPPLEGLGHFSVWTTIYHLQLWRFITFQFLHANKEHLFFNMLAVYFFGPLLESYLGSRRFITFYLMCGVAGPIVYVILWSLGALGHGGAENWVPLVGASAGIFGILIAAAQVAPDVMVLMMFIPMRLRTMAWVLLGIAVWVIFTGGANAGGQAAHLGGAVVGWVLIQRPQWLDWHLR